MACPCGVNHGSTNVLEWGPFIRARWRLGLSSPVLSMLMERGCMASNAFIPGSMERSRGACRMRCSAGDSGLHESSHLLGTVSVGRFSHTEREMRVLGGVR